jgi:hypothetical protein
MDYPPRVGKSENIYKLWETGEGDMDELAIGLYDLTAHYKALWTEHEALIAERDALVQLLFDLRKIFRERASTYSCDDAVILRDVSKVLMEHGMDEAPERK